MSKEITMKRDYQINLYYGYQVFEDGDVVLTVEAVDPDKKVNERKMENKLAEVLDTTRFDDRFDYGSMLIQLPNSVVKKIKKDAIREHLAKGE